MRLFLRRFSVRQLPDGLLFALLCATMVSAATVHAATLIVTSTADSGAGHSAIRSPQPATGTRFSSIPRSMDRPSL